MENEQVITHINSPYVKGCIENVCLFEFVELCLGVAQLIIDTPLSFLYLQKLPLVFIILLPVPANNKSCLETSLTNVVWTYFIY